MIFVDECYARGAPWAGGRSSHMVSDESLDELQSMAARLRLPQWWLQQPPRSSMYHYDISPKHRARAISFGARSCDFRELVAATRRFRWANPRLFPQDRPRQKT